MFEITTSNSYIYGPHRRADRRRESGLAVRQRASVLHVNGIGKHRRNLTPCEVLRILCMFSLIGPFMLEPDGNIDIVGRRLVLC